MAEIKNTLILGKVTPGQPSTDDFGAWAKDAFVKSKEEDLTLEEIFKELKKELAPINPPLSFSTDMFRREMGFNSRTTALEKLHKLEEEGRVKQIRYHIEDSRGRSQTIVGWQWITK